MKRGATFAVLALGLFSFGFPVHAETKSDPICSGGQCSIFLSFSSESDLESYWQQEIGQFVDAAKDYLFSTVPHTPGSGSFLEGLKTHGGLAFHRGLFPFTRDVQAKLYSKVPPTFPVCDDYNPSGTCADAAEPPRTLRQATDAWINMCGTYETISRIWLETIAKDHLALRKAEFKANPDKRWEAKFVQGDAKPLVAEFEEPLLHTGIPLGTSQHFGAGPVITDGLGIVYRMIAGHKIIVTSSTPAHPCLRAVMNMLYGSGTMHQAGVQDVDPFNFMVYPLEIPQDVCDAFDLTAPPPPSGAGVAEVNKTCFQNTSMINWPPLDPPDSAPGFVLSKTQEIAERVRNELKSTTGSEGKFETIEGAGSPISLPLPQSDISAPEVIGRIIRTLIGVSGALAFAFMVYGGALYMFSAGNEELIDRGRRTLVWSTLGLVAMFGAYAIVTFLITALVG